MEGCQNFIMPFGKYKGKDLLFITENNPKYLLWVQTIAQGHLKEAVDSMVKTTYFKDAWLESLGTRSTYKPIESFKKESPTSVKYQYKCGWGCTSYNPCCDACDSATSELESGKWYVSASDKEYAHKRAVSGLDPWNGWDEGEGDE